MNKTHILLLFILILGACSKEIHPKKVYIAYLDEIQKTESAFNFPYETYLSDRANDVAQKKIERMEIKGYIDVSVEINDKQTKLTNKNTRVNPKFKDKNNIAQLFLKHWKRQAVMPEKYEEDWHITATEAKWIFKANSFPEQDTNLITTVFFLREGGWKIDKIVRIYKSQDGRATLESEMY